ncbi:hypothetical protein D3C75_946710 [compost metagenome]
MRCKLSEIQGGKSMSPTTIAKIAEKKKQLTADKKSQMIKAGGSIKTRNYIDAQEICREVRGK